MTQYEFDLLTEKYLAGNCSPDEIALLEKWAEGHLKNQQIINAFTSEQEAKETQERLWQSIQIDGELLRPNKILMPHWRWIGVAASLLLVVVYFVVYQSYFGLISDPVIHGIETKNSASSRQKIVLPDGSVVTLEKNSKIITAEQYGVQNRTVYLTGEAFFEIKRNEKMPFLVHAADLVTEVLGTSFRIKSRLESNTIEVSVKTGRVSVYTSKAEQDKRFNGVIITPNQRVVYDTEHKTIRQDIVEKPEVIAPQPLSLNFKETTIDSVLVIFQKLYGVEIVVANPALNQCSFTGNLEGVDLYQQLDFVCGVVNAQYEIRGTTVFISGQGCQPND